MSKYKEKFEELRAFLKLSDASENVEEKAEEVAEEAKEVLSEAAPEAEAAAPEAEEAPKAEYVSLSDFQALESKVAKFMESVTETLSAAIEMMNKNEANPVPEELSEVKEEVKLDQVVAHDPESIQKQAQVGFKIGQQRKLTTEDKVMSRLFAEESGLFG